MSTNTGKTPTIGLAGAVFTLVGFVIGASIYVLPGELYAVAGPAMLVSFLIASVPAAFTCLIAAQIGAAYPGNSANFLAVRDLLSPFWGFITVWTITGASVVALALLAVGFASYLAVLVPELSNWRNETAIAVTLAFAVVNALGARTAVAFQTAMVIGLIGALVLFAGAGLQNVEPANFIPFFTTDVGGVLTAAVPAFFAFLGFTLIVEIAEEVRSPGRTIPRALGISYAIILLAYIGVAVAVIGVLPPAELSGSAAPVADAAQRVLPGPLAAVIVFSALLAAATSVNGVLLLISRDVAELAHSGYLPARLAGTPGKAPVAAIWAIALIASGCIALGSTIGQYAVTTVLGYIFAQGLIAIAGWKLAGRDLPISAGWMKTACIVTLLSAVLFFWLSLSGDMVPALLCVAFIGIGGLVFAARTRTA